MESSSTRARGASANAGVFVAFNERCKSWLTGRAMTMKQTIDFQYPISYVKAGHQNPVRVFGKSSVEVELREISAALAPIVFEVGNPVERYNPTIDLFRKKADGELRKIAMIDGEVFTS